jgi:hypothetical protein
VAVGVCDRLVCLRQQGPVRADPYSAATTATTATTADSSRAHRDRDLAAYRLDRRSDPSHDSRHGIHIRRNGECRCDGAECHCRGQHDDHCARPAHAAALVDVIVTNVGGLRATLTAAFTYAFEAPYTLTAHTDTVVAGDQISVSWSVPRGELEDWIALCKVGQAYDDDWYDFTKGATSGTLTVAAPTQPGQYEFRYLFDDTFEVLAQSRPVTVR